MPWSMELVTPSEKEILANKHFFIFLHIMMSHEQDLFS
jgi:hypothetical protein